MVIAYEGKREGISEKHLLSILRWVRRFAVFERTRLSPVVHRLGREHCVPM